MSPNHTPLGPVQPEPAENQQAATPAQPVKISLWGPPTSGKTTYLAALDQAVTRTRNNRSAGNWRIVADDPKSSEKLKDWTHRLVQERQFPEKTEVGEEIPLQWWFIGDLTGTEYEQRRRGRRKPSQAECKFMLDLVDVSGEAFSHSAEREIKEKALNRLEEADGLIYLFDPITERDKRSAFPYLDSILKDLSFRMKDKLITGRLPHQVSVCVTKFDDKDLLFQARQAHLVSSGPDGLPRVPDEHAEEFFSTLCEGNFWGKGEHDEETYTGATWVRDALREGFLPDRIKYYVTSSIGYWRQRSGNHAEPERTGSNFDPDDFSNVVNVPQNGENIPKIRGAIHPINVLEPLISLQQRILQQRLARQP